MYSEQAIREPLNREFAIPISDDELRGRLSRIESTQRPLDRTAAFAARLHEIQPVQRCSNPVGHP